ncbi:beta-1,3-glucosyltransferase isoform X1 [Zophobas morio]|uniref:beta-1,3-glucosyltransferase isoform X1 n=1 Tax=Zophobas morio TaxID=2755281 RepID=UPI0030831F76
MVKMETVVIFLLFFGTVWGLGIKDVVIIILSQPNEHHLKLAENLKNDIEQQAEALQQGKPIVHLSHRDFPHVGHWTVLPLVEKLHDLHGENSSWVFFVEDRTRVNLGVLSEVLNEYDPSKAVWLGHALHDNEATIIHHFAFYEDPQKFKFPNLGSGIAISTNLLQRLAERLRHPATPHSDFEIDSSHELALFIWDKGKGEVLTNDNAFCIQQDNNNCASYPLTFQPCGALVEKDSIYFAVKTCEKYHKERVPVVKKTWAQYASNVEFFSDEADVSIPTINLGIPNTEQGHCAKTIAILHHIHDKLKHHPRVQWVVVADDDTILGVSRIQQLLTCYNATKLVALGERYGYNVHSARGYNYITGGGGMVFSRALLKQLTRPGVCECPSISAPDDMFLGLCIASLGVSVTHSPLFHQARPIDYPPQYLLTKDAVSFHKHWMIDPIGVYDKWFAEEDMKGADVHVEL